MKKFVIAGFAFSIVMSTLCFENGFWYQAALREIAHAHRDPAVQRRGWADASAGAKYIAQVEAEGRLSAEELKRYVDYWKFAQNNDEQADQEAVNLYLKGIGGSENLANVIFGKNQ